jgi:hypothetical protein
MATRNPNDFIPVNGALNLKPSFGPIPADQLIPWAVIALANVVVANRILGLSWIITILSIGWGIATWWIVTGSDASRFLSKFHNPPLWLYGNLPYYSPLHPMPELDPAKAAKAAKKAERQQHRKSRRRPKRRRINT